MRSVSTASGQRRPGRAHGGAPGQSRTGINPTENLWHYLRSHYWSNRAYVDYDDLRHAACDAWQKTCLDADTIKTVCCAPYLDKRDVNV